MGLDGELINNLFIYRVVV